MKRGFATGKVVAWLGVLCVVLGCRTGPSSLGRVEPGWRVREGQAVWRPRRGADEVAGELTVASGGPTAYLVEFSKPAMPLVRVVRKPEGWVVTAPGRGTFTGRGSGPRLGWLEVGGLLSGGALRAPWHGAVEARTGEWWVEHPRTGERIEGYVTP